MPPAPFYSSCENKMKKILYILLLFIFGAIERSCTSSNEAYYSLHLWCGQVEVSSDLNAHTSKLVRSLTKRNNNVLVYCDNRDYVILSSFSKSIRGNILSIYKVTDKHTTQFDSIYDQPFDWIYSFKAAPNEDGSYGFLNFGRLDGSTIILFCNGEALEAILPEYDQLQSIDIDTISNFFYRNYAHLISDYIFANRHWQ